VIEGFPVVAALEEILLEEANGAGGKAGMIIGALLLAGLLLWLFLR